MNLVSTLFCNNTQHKTTVYTAVVASLAIVGVFATATPAFAQVAQSDDKKNESPWNVSVGLFVVTMPEYEGAKARMSSLGPDFNLSYRTEKWGTFGIGSKARGVSWTALEDERYSFGFTLGSSAGRSEKDGTVFRPGSKRLRGMGEIKAAEEYGVFGHVVAGIPIRLQIMKGSGDGKPSATNFSVKGHGGTTATLSTEIPCELTKDIALSFSAGLNWADKKYTQTYFGVTPAQAARTKFKAYSAEGGVKSVDLGVTLNYKIDRNWSAITSLNYSQLQGDAAKSPLTEKKAQPSAMIGINYSF